MYARARACTYARARTEPAGRDSPHSRDSPNQGKRRRPAAGSEIGMPGSPKAAGWQENGSAARGGAQALPEGTELIEEGENSAPTARFYAASRLAASADLLFPTW